MAVDPNKLEQFMGRALGDMGGAMSAPLVLLGDRLGLYKALAGAGKLTAKELAERTGTNERYISEWLNNQAAGGYVRYDAGAQRYWMDDEQVFTMADESSPAFLPGGYQVISALFHALDRMEDNFRSGDGMKWGDHHHCLFHGTERFFRSGYAAHLVSAWIPALEVAGEKLAAGARAADVGCGHGASTILMAQAFPNSSFVGFDNHADSVATARKRAKDAGLGEERVRFETASSTDFPGDGYDLIANFDCLHDMGDPVGAAKHVHRVLAPGGTWMIVEPFAHDTTEDNHNPVGRIFYGASAMICVPASKAYGGPALGAQAGEERLRQVANQGGFRQFRRATQTPFNLILEARK